MESKDGEMLDVKNIAEKFEIVISSDYGLSIDPDWVEVGQGATVVFVADKVAARVFFPERVLEPVGETAEKQTTSGVDYLVFDIEAGQSLDFRAAGDIEIKLDYFVSRKYFAGLLEAVQVPPVIIIKKVDM